MCSIKFTEQLLLYSVYQGQGIKIWLIIFLGENWEQSNSLLQSYCNDPKFSQQTSLGKRCRPRSDCFWHQFNEYDMRWHNKINKMIVRPAKTQISLVMGICPVWSGSLLSTWKSLGSLATHWGHSEDWSDWVYTQADLESSLSVFEHPL